MWGIFVVNSSILEVHKYFIEWWGPLFLRLLKLISLPIVCLTILHAICSPQKGISKLVFFVILTYLITTIIAISLGLGLASTFTPGENINIKNDFKPIGQEHYKTNYWFDFFISDNILKPFTENSSILRVLFIIILFGIAARNLNTSSKNFISKTLNILLEWIMKVINYILYVTPIGIFSLISNQIIQMQGSLSILYSLIKYMFVVIGSLIIMAYLIYPLLIFSLVKFSPIKFIKSCLPVQLFGFTTSSSAATIPITLNYAKNKLNVKEQIADFVIPLGATINMDGTAIYQAIATMFAAQMFGINFTFIQLLLLMLILIVSSIGTPSIPSGSIVIFSLIFQQFNIPPESLAIIMSVDRILDMMRTAVNVTGDLFTSVVVSKLIKD